MQRCPRCKRDRPLDAFPPCSRGVRGHWCRECHRVAKCGPTVDRSCDFCGAVLQVTERRAAESRVYCSRACKDKHRNEQARAARLAMKAPRTCLHCGADVPPSMRSDARFCSEVCNSAAHHLKRGNGRVGPGRRREIERAEIIERDGGRCHVCGKQCRPDEIHLDHVVPLARGGTHHPDNLAVACVTCNLRRRHLTIEEFMEAAA